GSGGIGTATHLSGELLSIMGGVKLIHVPYRGAGPAMIDMLGNRINMTFGCRAAHLELCEGRSAACDRGEFAQTRAVASGRARDRRDATRLRSDRVLGSFRAGRDAAGDRRQDQCRYRSR